MIGPGFISIFYLPGQCKLPSYSEMINDIEDKRDWMNSIYVSSPRHTLQVSSSRIFRKTLHYLLGFFIIEFKQ